MKDNTLEAFLVDVLISSKAQTSVLSESGLVFNQEVSGLKQSFPERE